MVVFDLEKQYDLSQFKTHMPIISLQSLIGN